MKIKPYHPFVSARAKVQYLENNDRRAQAWPIESECRTVVTSFGPTFMRISGPKDAPPLVMLPGAGINSLMWTSNIEGLAARHRTYCLDPIYDVGRSASTRPLKTGEDLACWLDELFDILKLGSRIRLMGLSFGGWLAGTYALRYPARIEKLVQLAPAGWIQPLKPRMLLNMVQTLLYPRRFFIRRSYLWSLPDLAASGPRGMKIIDDMTEDLVLAMRCYGLRRMMNMVEPIVMDDETLGSFEVPTLFVIGENERIYSCKEALARLERVAPRIATAVIPGAGHDMTWLKPELVNRRVLDFLDDS